MFAPQRIYKIFILGSALVGAHGARAEDLFTNAKASFYVDDGKGASRAGDLSAVSVSDKSLQLKFSGQVAGPFDGEQASNWTRRESNDPLRVDFANSDDAIFFKERVLKNPDLAIHVDEKRLSNSHDVTLDMQKYSLKLKPAVRRTELSVATQDVWVVNPKTGVRKRLSEMLTDKVGSRVALMNRASSEEAYADAGNVRGTARTQGHTATASANE